MAAVELSERQQRYDEATIARGLLAVIANGGNYQAAHEMLLEQGHHVPRTTLHFWAKHAHVDKYRQLHEEAVPKIHERIAAECEDFVIQAAGVEANILQHLGRRVHQLNANEAAGALRNVSTAKAINQDKLLVMRDKPNQIVEQRAPDQILRQLAKRYGIAIDSTAQEITDVELVPERTATSSEAGV